MKDGPAAPSPEQIRTVTPPTYSRLPQLFTLCCSTADSTEGRCFRGGLQLPDSPLFCRPGPRSSSSARPAVCCEHGSLQAARQQPRLSGERLQAEVWKRASRLSSGSVSQPYAYTHPPVAPAALQPAGPVCPTQPGPYLGEPVTGGPFIRVLQVKGSRVKTCAGVHGCFPPGSADVTSFLMTEARQQNTEIRLSIGKVADKVDQLTSKVGTVRFSVQRAAAVEETFTASL